MMLRGGERIGNWIVDAPLGSGGMGQVMRAHNAVTPLVVGALKVLVGSADREARARFVREAEALARLRHPTIVRVMDFGEQAETGMLYLVMELAEGRTLLERLRHGPLAQDEARAVFGALAEAVEHAHAAGVAHRDIKPANIILCHDGTVRLVDFGIATGEDWATLSGARPPGTPRYLGPEALTQDAQIDPKALDVYALGVTLYESLSGRQPFPTNPDLGSASAMQAAIIGRKLQQTEPLDLDGGFADTLRAAVRMATQPNPALRPTMAVLRELVAPHAAREGDRTERVVDGAGGVSRRGDGTRRPEAPRAPRRSALRLLGGAVAAVLVLAFGALAWQRTRSGPAPRLPVTSATKLADLHVVRVSVSRGDGAVRLLNETRGMLASEATGRTLGTLARDGDWLLASLASSDGGEREATLALPYRSSDGTALHLERDGPCVLVNTRRVCCELTSDEGWEWLEQAPAGALAELRVVSLSEPGAHLSALEKLAAARPDVGLIIGSSDAAAILRFFETRALMLADNVAFERLAPRLNRVETLVGELRAEALPHASRLPRVLRLVVPEWAPPEAGAWPSLASLTLGHETASLEGLERLEHLRELFVRSARLEDAHLAPLARVRGIETLSLTGSANLLDPSVLDAHAGLRWLGLPPQTTQAQFARAARAHPALEVLDLRGCTEVHDLEPLAGLAALRGVLLADTSDELDLAPLHGLKQLEIVFLGRSDFEDGPSQRVLQLEAARPGLVVTQG